MNTATVTTTETITFSLQFGGFYHSHHSNVVEDRVETYYSDGEYPEYEDDNINWQATHENYAKEWLDMFEEHIIDMADGIELDLTYKSLWSPKFYNFETDEIIAEIPEQQFELLRDEFIKSEEFVEWVNEASKSRDGFMSFYSGLEEVSAEPKIFLNYLFRWFIKTTQEDWIYNLYELEFEIELNSEE